MTPRIARSRVALFRERMLPLVHSRRDVARLLAGGPVAQRRDFYARRWDTWRWRLLFHLFFSRAGMSRFGRDPSCFSYVEGSVASRILERTRYALTELDPAENPYVGWILTGRHPHALGGRADRGVHRHSAWSDPLRALRYDDADPRPLGRRPTPAAGVVRRARGGGDDGRADGRRVVLQRRAVPPLGRRRSLPRRHGPLLGPGRNESTRGRFDPEVADGQEGLERQSPSRERG